MLRLCDASELGQGHIGRLSLEEEGGWIGDFRGTGWPFVESQPGPCGSGGGGPLVAMPN